MKIKELQHSYQVACIASDAAWDVYTATLDDCNNNISAAAYAAWTAADAAAAYAWNIYISEKEMKK